MNLTPEQQAVVSTWGKGQAVLAGAGSGKTTTLVVKCEELLKRNPAARFAAVSFTEKSASELRGKLSERGLLDDGKGEGQGRHWVTTIHGLCSTIMREFPRLAGLDGEETVLTAAEAELLWKQAIHSLWFGELQDEVLAALEALLGRESRAGVIALLGRVKSLHGFGVLERLGNDPESEALRKVSGFVLERYEKLKRRRGAVDFDDLEKAADRVLESETARAAFHKRFDLVLVDEFQDTNPVQARILWRFIRPGRDNVCVVGDPKQSIYRFRDADVTVFEQYCATVGVRQSLTWNFRSRPAVLEFVNRVCAPLFAASALPYEELVPRREPAGAGGGAPVGRLTVSDPAELARWIRAEQARGVPLGDMAIVLRKLRGNEKWLKPLLSAQIPLAIGSGGFFWEDPRVRECVAALSWWDNPGNTLSGAAFLRAPWMGIPDQTLDRWVQEDPTFYRPFFSSDHPVARLLAPDLCGCLSPGDFLLRFLEHGPAESELGIALLSLWHRAEELSLGGLDFHQVVREFRDCVELGRREADVPPPQNAGQVRVMTIHGSKGLEFPVVILADFSGPWRGSRAPLLFWDREKGAYLGRRGDDGKRADKEDPVEQVFRAEEKAKDLCESKRLFYVALTRAQERLVLVTPVLEPRENKRKTEADPKLSDHWRAWLDTLGGEIPALEGGPAAELPAVRDAAPGEAGRAAPRAALTRLRRPRHSVTEWMTLARCARAYEWTYLRPGPEIPESTARSFPDADSDSASDSESGRMDSRELGTAVHSILERAEFLPESEWVAELEALAERAGERQFNAAAVRDWIRTCPWLKPHAGAQSWRELSFEVPISVPGLETPAVLIGAMDRLVTDPAARPEQRYVLLDFKVTGRVKSSSELHEAYQLQLALYVSALARLEPETEGATRAVLLNVHPGGVQEIEVEIPSWARSLAESEPVLRRFAEQADALLNGSSAAPHSGAHCAHCRFRTICGDAAL